MKVKWDRFERFILVLTFLCTAIITFYSVRTASKALIQSKINLRPWVSLPKIDVIIQNDYLEIKQAVENIGNIPCFVSIDSKLNIRYNDISKELEPEEYKILVLLPGQKIYYDYTCPNELKELIKHKSEDLDIILSVKVYYSEKKNDIGQYFTYNKSRLRVDMIPDNIINGYTYSSGIWYNLESDFK